jgi:Holliday junction resolvase RusA-like endonuclease
MEDLTCPYCKNRPPKRPVVRLVATGEAKDFRRYAHRHLPANPIAGPVELYVTVYLPTIASDGLNRIKALEDAINERLWFDDKQIAEWHVTRVITDDESKHGVVFEVRPANPAEHPELTRRLAASSIQERANEAAQPALFEPAKQEVRPRGPQMPEPLQQKLRALAKPAVIHPPPDDDPEGAA